MFYFHTLLKTCQVFLQRPESISFMSTRPVENMYKFAILNYGFMKFRSNWNFHVPLFHYSVLTNPACKL